MEKIQHFTQFLQHCPPSAEIRPKTFLFRILTICQLIFSVTIGTFCQLPEAPCLSDSIMLKLR